MSAITKPGWYRGALGMVRGAAFGFSLVVALRAISGLPIFQTEQTGLEPPGVSSGTMQQMLEVDADEIRGQLPQIQHTCSSSETGSRRSSASSSAC